MAQKNKIVWYSALLMTITTVILVSKLQLLHVYTLLELQVKFAILFNFKFRDSLSFKISTVALIILPFEQHTILTRGSLQHPGDKVREVVASLYRDGLKIGYHLRKAARVKMIEYLRKSTSIIFIFQKHSL